MSNLLDIALKYHAAGLRCIPVKADKRPDVPSWKQYQQAQTEDDIRAIFAGDRYGIAVLTGIGGLEVIDIDLKYDRTGKVGGDFVLYADKLNDDSPKIFDLVMQKTRSGGYHVFYRCKTPGGNMKLAQRPAYDDEEPGTTPVLLETRGVGGYVIVSPTPGYEVKTGDLASIPTIPQSARDAIIAAARAFDELPEVEPIYVPKGAYTAPPGASVTPWDDFNDRESAVDLLIKYGWTMVYRHGEKVFLRRPGKTDAKTSGNYHEGRKVFVSHTTSTCLPAEKGLTAWSIYKYYMHGGDASAAGKALYAAGYGTRYEKPEPGPSATAQPALTPEQKAEQEDNLMKEVWQSRYVYGPIKKEQATFTHQNWESGKAYNIGGPGMLGAITGKKKSGKTFVMLHIVASAMTSGFGMMGFSLRLAPGQNILFVDTEQSRFFFELTQHDMHDLAGVQAPENYYAFHLRKYSVSERLTALKKLVAEIPNLGLIVIDGIVDLCRDMMDYDTSSKTVQELMTICEQTGAMVLTVLHLTKQSGEMRGHLGTELGNKCDFSLMVEKDIADAWFTVRCLDSRFSPFQTFRFCRDLETGRAIYNDNRSAAVKHMNGSIPNMLISPSAATEQEVPF